MGEVHLRGIGYLEFSVAVSSPVAGSLAFPDKKVMVPGTSIYT
jgi:hypothetical protein